MLTPIHVRMTPIHVIMTDQRPFPPRRRLPNGNYEVGVHIADVSYFVVPNTPLDQTASERSTSVYLIQKVISGLPPRCFNAILTPFDAILTPFNAV